MKQILWENVFENNYGTPAIHLKRGKGLYVWDLAGKKYLDFIGGIATNVVGHADASVVKAVSTQIATLGHVSNLYAHPKALALASKLQGMISQPSKVFFCNSGAEANEAALKISRLTGRNRIISTEGGFHGRTLGALSMTGQPSKRAPFIPLLKGITFLPFGDIKAMERKISHKTAMVIVEPIQGENGVIVPPIGYLKSVSDLCKRFDVLLCIDAVQTGMGRTGQWFGYENENFSPDIITVAKGFGGGLPLGAMITVGEKVPHFSPGEHGSTFGGNPISCAAGLAAIEVIEKKKLRTNALRMEEKIRASIESREEVDHIRGRGLLLGIVLKDPIAKQMVQACAHNGLLLNAPNDFVLRIAPALTLSDLQVKEFAKKFSKSLDEVVQHA